LGAKNIIIDQKRSCNQHIFCEISLGRIITSQNPKLYI
jgi:hypothetical protein